jgi:hypothetical protein
VAELGPPPSSSGSRVRRHSGKEPRPSLGAPAELRRQMQRHSGAVRMQLLRRRLALERISNHLQLPRTRAAGQHARSS